MRAAKTRLILHSRNPFDVNRARRNSLRAGRGRETRRLITGRNRARNCAGIICRRNEKSAPSERVSPFVRLIDYRLTARGAKTSFPSIRRDCRFAGIAAADRDDGYTSLLEYARGSEYE